LQLKENPQDIGGHYQPNPEATSKAMRPSETFTILAKIALIKLLTIFKRQPETVVFFILAIP
jgi:hypothetical protein